MQCNMKNYVIRAVRTLFVPKSTQTILGVLCCSQLKSKKILGGLSHEIYV